ncbi:MAG: hypothetical protein ACRD9R_16560 [Pyrinomonadaceae bacterium]
MLVRAVSRDAKVIGTRVGGARITVREAATGKILAEGLQQGETGSTDLIMLQPRRRGAAVYDTPGAASFVAELALARPTVVEITAEGPLGASQAVRRVSKQMLVMPGQHVLGEGVLLEIHGLIVSLVASPPADEARTGTSLDVRATVTLTCGCPTEPGGTWDANKIQIVARLLKDGRMIAETPLSYAGTQSTYAGRLELKTPGEFELEVLASDAANANFGQFKQKLTVAR